MFPLHKMLSARFALLNIVRKIHCVSFLIAGTPFTQPALIDGCISIQRAQFVEFHCGSFLRKSACNQCSVQSSDLIIEWSPSAPILITVYRQAPAFHQEHRMIIGCTQLKRISLHQRVMEWKPERASPSWLRIVRLQKIQETNMWIAHLIHKMRSDWPFICNIGKWLYKCLFLIWSKLQDWDFDIAMRLKIGDGTDCKQEIWLFLLVASGTYSTMIFSTELVSEQLLGQL